MRIFKSSLTKKILGALVIVGCSGIFLNGYVGVGESVHAQEQVTGISDEGTNSSFDTMGLWQILDMVLKLIYILLWPLLVIAGLALDNTLVYASVFHMDAPLWKFWNMMKNFANFALGFMVLFAIIKSILTNSGQGTMKDEKTPLGIIKMTLIAGILIQASRFLVAATVDISTVATYAVGGLPLSVLKNTDIGNQKILSVNSSIDLNKFEVLSEEGENFKVWYSTNYKDGDEIKKVEFSPCRIEEGYIVGRQYKEAKFTNTGIFESGQSACVALGKQIVIYNEFPALANKEGSNYKLGIDDMLGFGWNVEDHGTRKRLQACGYIIPLNPGKDLEVGTCGEDFSEIYSYIQSNSSSYNIEDYEWLNQTPPSNTYTPGDKNIGIEKGTARFNGENVIATTVSELIEKSKGFVGPLVTIYSSLLNFAQLTDTNTTSIGETSGIFIIKTAVAIALFFPLLALAVVLIMRIGVLRLYIVASPFIVLKACFKDFIKIEKLDKYLDVKGVIGIIFAPVVTVAALSISLIFMTALVNGFTSSGSSEEMNQTFGTQTITAIHTGNDAISFNNVAEIEFTKLPWGEAMDWFSRLMVNFFAIGLMWMIVFAAIKANEIGKGAGQKIQDFGQNFFQTMPILPIGEGGSRVGVGSAKTVLGGAPSEWIRQKEGEQTRMATDFVWGNQTGGTTTTITTEQAKGFVTAGINTSAGIQSEIEKLGVKKEEVVNVLNASADAIYAAVQGNANETALQTAFTEAGLTTTSREAAEKKAQLATAKTAIDTTIVPTITDTMTKDEVQSKLDIPNNTTLLNNYFTIAPTETTYIITTAGGKQVTITKKTDGTYEGTAPVTAPTS